MSIECYKRPYESYFVAVRRSITHPKEGSHRHKRPKVWTLTLEEFVQVIETTAACHYCAEPLVWPSAFGASKWRSNLDRKDNDQGYTAENVVGCCFSCNTAKSNKLRYEEMLLVGAYRRQHPYMNMKQPSEQEIDRLQTKARAATTLRAELASLSRSARRLSRLAIEGSLRPTLEDLEEENAQNDYGRSAVADVAGQVYRTSKDADWKKPLESAVKTCIGILSANLPPEQDKKEALKALVSQQCNMLGVSNSFLDQKARQFCADGRVIDAIKYVRDTAQLGLKEAKEYVDILRGL